MGTETTTRIESQCDRCDYKVVANGEFLGYGLPADWAHVEVGREQRQGFYSTTMGQRPLFQGIFCPPCKDVVMTFLKRPSKQGG